MKKKVMTEARTALQLRWLGQFWWSRFLMIIKKMNVEIRPGFENIQVVRGWDLP